MIPPGHAAVKSENLPPTVVVLAALGVKSGMDSQWTRMDDTVVHRTT